MLDQGAIVEELPPFRLSEPDPSFSLSAETRKTIQQGYDLDALERLLAWVHPDARAIVLEGFQPPTEPGVLGGAVMMIADPLLQELLNEVWAPRWEWVPKDLWDHPDFARWPGKEIALEKAQERGGSR